MVFTSCDMKRNCLRQYLFMSQDVKTIFSSFIRSDHQRHVNSILFRFLRSLISFLSPLRSKSEREWFLRHFTSCRTRTKKILFRNILWHTFCAFHKQSRLELSFERFYWWVYVKNIRFLLSTHRRLLVALLEYHSLHRNLRGTSFFCFVLLYLRGV